MSGMAFQIKDQSAVPFGKLRPSVVLAEAVINAISSVNRWRRDILIGVADRYMPPFQDVARLRYGSNIGF